MKVYADYNGEIPAGVVVLREGSITRINFDYDTETKEVDGEDVEVLVFENVDIEGDIEYGKIVSAIVRDKYSQDKVEAIVVNGEDTPEHKTELRDFKDWRVKAKNIAHAVISKLSSAEEEE